MRLAARLVVFLNDKQPGVLPLRAGIGLERAAGQAGDFHKPFLQLPEKGLIAARLRKRRERVYPRKLRPCDRQHLRRSVELHRAGAERDHRRCQ